jgi:Protein of unknown function (DUF2442)
MDSFDRAIARAKRRRATQPVAVAAQYDAAHDRVVVELSTGTQFAFPRRQAEGLDTARRSALKVIEITPSGFGLHFPRLDADLWLPGLLEGVFGTREWMASRLGARGGQAKTEAKARAARANGKLGGRPRKTKAGARTNRRRAG